MIDCEKKCLPFNFVTEIFGHQQKSFFWFQIFFRLRRRYSDINFFSFSIFRLCAQLHQGKNSSKEIQICGQQWKKKVDAEPMKETGWEFADFLLFSETTENIKFAGSLEIRLSTSISGNEKNLVLGLFFFTKFHNHSQFSFYSFFFLSISETIKTEPPAQ